MSSKHDEIDPQVRELMVAEMMDHMKQVRKYLAKMHAEIVRQVKELQARGR